VIKTPPHSAYSLGIIDHFVRFIGRPENKRRRMKRSGKFATWKRKGGKCKNVVEKTLTKEINGNKRKAVPLLWDN
jgi:hypothetical protein